MSTAERVRVTIELLHERDEDHCAECEQRWPCRTIVAARMAENAAPVPIHVHGGPPPPDWVVTRYDQGRGSLGPRLAEAWHGPVRAWRRVVA